MGFWNLNKKHSTLTKISHDGDVKGAIEDAISDVVDFIDKDLLGKIEDFTKKVDLK